MDNTDFQILTRLYGFLAEFGPDEMLSACRRRPMSENIREALAALAKEARAGRGAPVKLAKILGGKPRLPRPKRSRPEGSGKELLAFLLDTKRFPDKAVLAQFALKIGAPETANPKYSRERVAQRIMKRTQTDESFRKKLMDVVDSLTGRDAQSEGWMDLILRK